VQHRALDALVDGVARADRRQAGEDEIRSGDRRVHHDRDPERREVRGAVPVRIRLTEQIPPVSGDGAAEERCGVEGLPRRQVVAEDDGDLLGRGASVGHVSSLR